MKIHLNDPVSAYHWQIRCVKICRGATRAGNAHVVSVASRNTSSGVLDPTEELPAIGGARYCPPEVGGLVILPCQLYSGQHGSGNPAGGDAAPSLVPARLLAMQAQ
jgi:hypothetical protein